MFYLKEGVGNSESKMFGLLLSKQQSPINSIVPRVPIRQFENFELCGLIIGLESNRFEFKLLSCHFFSFNREDC